MKLESNGLWESSRLILPEHKEAIIAQYNSQLKRERKIMADDELEQLSYRLHESLQLKVSISLQMYDQYEEMQVVGIVERIDIMKKQFRINGDWFNISDVEKVID